MKIKELMTAGVVAVRKEETLGEAGEKVESLGIHALPVTDQVGLLVGIISMDDLVRGHEQTLPVSRVMSSRVQTLPPDAEAADAARLMREHRLHHIVVLDGRKIVGMLSSLDLLQLLE